MMNEGVSLMKMCTESEQLDIFEVSNFTEITQYRWNRYGLYYYLIGFIFHIYYIVLQLIYVHAVYINGEEDKRAILSKLIIIGIFYPIVEELLQLGVAGFRDYFLDPANWANIVYIVAGILNVVVQSQPRPTNEMGKSQDWKNKALMILILLIQIPYTFTYLKIFESLTKIVTMLKDVIADLRVFIFFFVILILLFSMTFAVLGLGNENFDGKFKTYHNDATDMSEAYKDEVKLYHGSEYKVIGKFAGYFLTVLRTSLGDFQFDASQYLESEENIMFWIMWGIMVVISCIIFLNFIIAETGKSYTQVDERLEATIAMEKANLVDGAEETIPYFLKNDIMFPKYIVIRDIET